ELAVGIDPARSNRSTLAGEYDGISWKIQPGSKLILDVGPQQEMVTVQPMTFALDPIGRTGTFQAVIAKPHAPDFPITNTLLGNPGPQPGLSPREPLGSATVRYLSIIE